MDLKPRIIFWETTNRCNLKCGYCRMSPKKAKKDLTTAEAFKTIDAIKKNFGAPILVLSGGEPLLREDIFDIISHAVKAGLRVALATNGVLLGEKEAWALKANGITRVSLSLDASDEKSHDASRGVPGAFKKTQEAAGILKAQGIQFQINFTVTKLNVQELSSVEKLAKDLGAVAVHYFVLVPVGCGKEIQEDVMLSGREAEDVLRTIKAIAKDSHLEIKPTCAPQYVRVNPESSSGCLAGTATFFISSDGNIYPCGYLPVKAGSLRESPLGDIWKDSLVFKTLRKNNLKGECAGCSVKAKCRGCRARAYGVTGDYMAGDVTCILNREEALV
ncbi:MAG: radical SAM protein [Candidatus Omnitrophica bacterium]|nr:radical SAM protein [Candidatus Omnitrophota bacterium]